MIKLGNETSIWDKKIMQEALSKSIILEVAAFEFFSTWRYFWFTFLDKKTYSENISIHLAFKDHLT
jgi:hypothetical protein